MRCPDLIVATTELMIEELRKRIGDQVFLLVPNGVDTSYYKPCYKYRETTKTGNIVVFLGDLNFKYHKLDIFVQSTKILPEEDYKIRLKIIRAGKELPKLKYLARKLNIQGHIEFLGYIPRDSIHKLLGTATFAVAGRPSIPNPWIISTIRLTIHEYLLCGLSILAYGSPDSYTQYFIKKHNIGIHIPFNNPKDIAEATIELIEKSRQTPLIPAICRQVAKQYDWSNVMSTFVSKIKEVL